MPVGPDYERELVFRMKMPRGVVAVAANDFAVERLPLRPRRLFKNRLHSFILKWRQMYDKRQETEGRYRRRPACEFRRRLAASRKQAPGMCLNSERGPQRYISSIR